MYTVVHDNNYVPWEICAHQQPWYCFPGVDPDTIKRRAIGAKARKTK